jgi:hypothetical protein
MEPFPFCKLPPELRNAIHFESGLDDNESLALTIAINDPQEECALVQEFLMKKIHRSLHEDTLSTVLAVQQTIYHTGAVNGSFDWTCYAACKQALYENEELVLDETRLAIRFCDIHNVMQKTNWAYLISLACDANWRDWIRADDTGFPFAQTVQTEGCFEDASKTELQRLVLAVYQFDAYTSRLQKGAAEMSYEEAAALSKTFFQHLTPWEKEQIISIGEIITQVLDQGSLLSVLPRLGYGP